MSRGKGEFPGVIEPGDRNGIFAGLQRKAVRRGHVAEPVDPDVQRIGPPALVQRHRERKRLVRLKGLPEAEVLIDIFVAGLFVIRISVLFVRYAVDVSDGIAAGVGCELVDAVFGRRKGKRQRIVFVPVDRDPVVAGRKRDSGMLDALDPRQADGQVHGARGGGKQLHVRAEAERFARLQLPREIKVPVGGISGFAGIVGFAHVRRGLVRGEGFKAVHAALGWHIYERPAQRGNGKRYRVVAAPELKLVLKVAGPLHSYGDRVQIPSPFQCFFGIRVDAEGKRLARLHRPRKTELRGFVERAVEALIVSLAVYLRYDAGIRIAPAPEPVYAVRRRRKRHGRGGVAHTNVKIVFAGLERLVPIAHFVHVYGDPASQAFVAYERQLERDRFVRGQLLQKAELFVGFVAVSIIADLGRGVVLAVGIKVVFAAFLGYELEGDEVAGPVDLKLVGAERKDGNDLGGRRRRRRQSDRREHGKHHDQREKERQRFFCYGFHGRSSCMKIQRMIF